MTNVYIWSRTNACGSFNIAHVLVQLSSTAFLVQNPQVTVMPYMSRLWNIKRKGTPYHTLAFTTYANKIVQVE